MNTILDPTFQIPPILYNESNGTKNLWKEIASNIITPYAPKFNFYDYKQMLKNLDPSQYPQYIRNHIQRMVENDKLNDETSKTIPFKQLKIVSKREKEFQRVSTPTLKDKNKKEHNLRSPANKTKICLLESNHNGLRTKEYFENEGLFTGQNNNEESMEETETKSITNIFDTLGISKKGKKSNLLKLCMSSSKLNLLNQDSNQSLLNTANDITLVKQKPELNRARLSNSLYEQQEEGKSTLFLALISLLFLRFKRSEVYLFEK